MITDFKVDGCGKCAEQLVSVQSPEDEIICDDIGKTACSLRLENLTPKDPNTADLD